MASGNDSIKRCQTLRQQRAEWSSDVERMQTIISTLRSAYSVHKHDIFLTRQHALEEMIEAAVTGCKTVDDESIKRRAPQHVDRPTTEKGCLAQSEESKRSVERLAERIAEKRALQGMKKNELEEEELKLKRELASLQREYKAMLRRLQTLGNAFATSKQQSSFSERYSLHKQMIKAVIRASPGDDDMEDN